MPWLSRKKLKKLSPELCTSIETEIYDYSVNNLISGLVSK